ncbi:MAG: glycosyltransferase [Thermoplasmata archaeon]
MADKGQERMLIAGPPFRGYIHMVADAFRSEGLEVSVLQWQYPKRNAFQEVLYYSSRSFRVRLGEAQDRRNASAVEKAVLASPPSYLLVLKGVELTEKARHSCQSAGTKLVLWAYDSATEFPVIQRCAPAYDLVYTYEPADIELLSGHCEPKLLPMAYDPGLYFRSPEKRDIDISFVGGIDLYPERVMLLRRIGREFKAARIGVWTDSIHWYSHRQVLDALRFGVLRNIELHRQTLEHRAINVIYNRSRICLNVHHPQSARALNPRTFEILGSGGLLVTDRKLDYIKGFEDGRGYIYYSNEEHLVENLRELLEDDEGARRVSDEGYRRVRAHTYRDRARQILADLR